MSANRIKENDQEKQVKNEPIDDQYLDGNVGNSMRNMHSEVSISSQIHSKNMKSGTIAENDCNESMNPSIERMPPHHQIGQTSSISSSISSEIHKESRILKRKSDSETTLLPSSINMKKVKNEEIFDETVEKAMEIETEYVHKYWFNAFNIKEETDLDRQFAWLQKKGLKNGFEPRHMSSELMRIKSKKPKAIQRFCVTSKKEADQVRRLISSQKWVKCFCVRHMRNETSFIWDLMRQEDIVIPLLIATKAFNENEMHLEMHEMTKRCESNDSIRLALSDSRVIKSVRKSFDTEAKAKLDQLCEELNVEKDIGKLKKMAQAARLRREEENKQKEREFNANFR